MTKNRFRFFHAPNGYGKGSLIQVQKYISFPPQVGEMTDEMQKYT